MALAVAISAMLLTIGVTRAHDGAAHVSHATDGFGGLSGLLAVVFATGIVYWLTNRGDRRPVHSDHPESPE
jgi:hypothetical protein